MMRIYRALGIGPLHSLHPTVISRPRCSRLNVTPHRPCIPTSLRSLNRHGAFSKKRFASTTSQAATDARSLVIRLKNLLLGTVIGASSILGYYYVTDTRASIHQWLVVPSLRWIYNDAEEAHEAGTKALKILYDFGLHPRERGIVDPENQLQVEVFGHTLRNPIGTSAGIDKHAEIPSPLLALGPSVVEIGGVTPYPQDGNPKPRVFRLPSQRAFINRYGLNSEGADSMAMRLRQRVREYAYAIGFGIDEVAEQRILDGEAGVPPGSLVEGKLLAVQVAKNKFTPDNDIEAIRSDYVYCVDTLAKYADIIVVNVSSPNTPGLRDLQKVKPLTDILTAVVNAAKNADRKTKPAVMVKVSPDEDSDEQVSGICQAVSISGVDGVIVGNTTKQRPDPVPAGYSLPNREAALLLEQGGYSGPQLFDRTVGLVKKYRKMLDRNTYHDEPTHSSLQLAAPSPNPQPQPPSREAPSSDTMTDSTVSEKIVASVQRDLANLKSQTAEAEADSKFQPLIRLPARNDPSSTETASPKDPPTLSFSNHLDQLPPAEGASVPSPDPSPPPPSAFSLSVDSPRLAITSQRKVIFATGGITNGSQALEVLNAGADVAMIYTALVYGGVGTISRIKDEMRREMNATK